LFVRVFWFADTLLLYRYPVDDFKRIADGKDKGAYYHEFFLYGRPALTMTMKRTKIKGDAKWIGYQPQDIDFYKMPPVQPSQQHVGSISIMG